MKNFNDEHCIILKAAIDDIVKIENKYKNVRFGKDGPATAETNKRWEQYHKEFAELKKKYNND